jgi:hypothetical protein
MPQRKGWRRHARFQPGYFVAAFGKEMMALHPWAGIPRWMETLTIPWCLVLACAVRTLAVSFFPRPKRCVRCPFSCSACRSSWRRAPELAPMVLAQARRSRAVMSPPTPCTPTDGPFSSASTHRLTVTGNVVEIGCCPRRTDAFLRKLWRPLPPANPVAKLVHVRVVATIVHRRLLLLFALLQRHRYNVPPCLRHRRLNRGATHCKVWKSRAR